MPDQAEHPGTRGAGCREQGVQDVVRLDLGCFLCPACRGGLKDGPRLAVALDGRENRVGMEGNAVAIGGEDRHVQGVHDRSGSGEGS